MRCDVREARLIFMLYYFRNEEDTAYFIKLQDFTFNFGRIFLQLVLSSLDLRRADRLMPEEKDILMGGGQGQGHDGGHILPQ